LAWLRVASLVIFVMSHLLKSIQKDGGCYP
jgi:hypothetical protein